jgi:hypothetical protein
MRFFRRTLSRTSSLLQIQVQVQVQVQDQIQMEDWSDHFFLNE